MTRTDGGWGTREPLDGRRCPAGAVPLHRPGLCLKYSVYLNGACRVANAEAVQFFLHSGLSPVELRKVRAGGSYTQLMAWGCIDCFTPGTQPPAGAGQK